MESNTSISEKSSGAGGCFPVIAEHAQEAVAVLDTNGIVHYANAAWIKMHGFDRRSEVVGRPISDFHNKQQLAADVLPLLREVVHRGQISGHIGHTNKNQTVLPTYTTMFALKDKTAKLLGVIVFALDTSELEQLKEDISNLKHEADKHNEELTLAAKSLEKQAKEMEIVENLLGARGAELSSVNKQLWQYMSQREQIQEQCNVLRTELVEKEKQIAELNARMQHQNAEHARLEQQWKSQYSELLSSIEGLRHEVIEMKHHEVEFLEDIDPDAEPVGAKGGVNRDQLRELSVMAKKFAGN
jgi:PAS domain S-box-containing protein